MSALAPIVVPAGAALIETAGTLLFGAYLGRKVFWRQRQGSLFHLDNAPGTLKMIFSIAFPKLGKKLASPKAINYELCMAMCSAISDEKRRLMCELYCFALQDNGFQKTF